ncbi:hypothetical protein AJ79_04904 [Helicocarpus griseus UAMH5409]|uniref:AA9 family lytic polysaccharide monooxygenase n=1 Tax=Helicocarpus griseus UAMH5409 TaxID=1447875 RepID=A0A2B7XRL8_9EURO|nr:hypothetical protein AJ79_04904 [Helicocarpus griseus UAMH5409]
MKVAALSLTLPMLASTAYGHCTLDHSHIFRTQTDISDADIFQVFNDNAVYQYIRENTNYNSPVTDLASNDLRCNVGATGANTETVTIPAGSEFSFTSDTAVYHQGPVAFYMAKAPGAASEYDGSGQSWFKIKEIGPTFNGGQAEWDMSSTYSATIPASVPDGDYLIRIEQLAIHNPWPSGIPQFYISCAQVTVTGGGSGSPSPLVAIPGHVSESDPGYTANIYNGLTEYTVPGPAVVSHPVFLSNPKL